MAIYYTAADIKLREATLGCCLATLAYKIAKKIGYGVACDLEITQLNLLNVYVEILSCYTPIINTAEDGVVNCIKEADLDAILEKITRCYTDYDLCFPPKGNATGFDPEVLPVTSLLLLEAGTTDIYLLEDGSRLLLEFNN